MICKMSVCENYHHCLSVRAYGDSATLDKNVCSMANIEAPSYETMVEILDWVKTHEMDLR